MDNLENWKIIFWLFDRKCEP